MADITELIRRDHETFRREFAELFASPDADVSSLISRWRPLAELLERHAGAEETTFYPALLADDADADDETKDAIGDHNKIRDAVRAAQDAAPGTDAWWDAVRKAHDENDDHMREEEEGPLPDFVSRSTPEDRESLGRAFATYRAERQPSAFDTADKDPDQFVDEHRSQ